MGQSSGIGVLDKAVVVLRSAAGGSGSLAEIVTSTGLPRATAHRIAVALERHGLLARDGDGRWRPGAALGELAGPALDPLLAAAPDILSRLRDETGESAQLYQERAGHRVCVAASERTSGLRDTVPVGARLPLTAGSAAQVLAAWAGPGGTPQLPAGALFSARTLTAVRRRGWAMSAGEREAGVASVSAPVYGDGGRLLAAISVSGPIDRLGRHPGAKLAPMVLDAAEALGARIRR